MDLRRAAAIGAGGVLGATARWAILVLVPAGGGMPWPVLALNVAGSLVLGVLLAEEWDHPRARVWLHDAGGIGFCGGLTTFSTFSVEIVDLVRDDEVVTAITYGTASLLLSIAGVLAGAGLLRHVRAASSPLEEEP